MSGMGGNNSSSLCSTSSNKNQGCEDQDSKGSMGRRSQAEV